MSNPAPRESIKRGADLFTDFTGHNPEWTQKIDIPPPKVLLQVGKIDGLLYETVRDGKTENYIHRFKKRARPDFCVSDDGSQIVLVGGNFTFTERGIVDN